MDGQDQPVAPVPGATLSSTYPAARRGNGPVRVLVLGVVGALVIGAGGYVVSVAVDSQPWVDQAAQTMCVDSNCTFAMSAGAPQAGEQQPAVQSTRHHSAPERLVHNVLYFCRIR